MKKYAMGCSLQDRANHVSGQVMTCITNDGIIPCLTRLAFPDTSTTLQLRFTLLHLTVAVHTAVITRAKRPLTHHGTRLPPRRLHPSSLPTATLQPAEPTMPPKSRKSTSGQKSNKDKASYKKKALGYYQGLTNVRSTVHVKGSKMVSWEEVLDVATAQDFGTVVESEGELPSYMRILMRSSGSQVGGSEGKEGAQAGTCGRERIREKAWDWGRHCGRRWYEGEVWSGRRLGGEECYSGDLMVRDTIFFELP